jgi:hypothetical protein
MDLLSGFQLEQPHVLVRWGISEDQLQIIFTGMELRRVTDGYFVIRCQSLGSLSHMLGFHFTPRINGTLLEFELFSTNYPDLQASYQAFQQHLEMAFGPATATSAGTEGFDSHVWLLAGGKVMHYVQEHFGPAEYVRIERSGHDS